MDAGPRTVFAMGGGGFTMEPGNAALDEYLLTLPGAAVEPHVLFLPTASGDAERQVAQFRHTFADRPCHATALSLFRLEATGGISLRDLVLGQDLVFVGGGSMRSMLAIWREYGLDAILREAWDRGVVLSGLSAGAMCWFAGGVTKSTGVPAPVRGLGLLPWSFSVHTDGQPDRLPVYEEAVRSGALPGGWAADDGVGLLFRDDELERVVTSRPRTGATRIESDGEGGLLRTPILPELLSASVREERAVTSDILEFRRARRAADARRAR